MTKTAFTTRAIGGLETEFAKLFAINGNNLVLVGRNLKKLTSLKISLENANPVKIEIVAVGFTAEDVAEQIFDQIKKMNVQIDYLIDNAGLDGQGTFIECTIKCCTRFNNSGIFLYQSNAAVPCF